MKNGIIIFLLSLLFISCRKFSIVEVQNHVIINVKKERTWNAVIQTWEFKSLAILDDSTEVRILESQQIGDTVRFIYIK